MYKIWNIGYDMSLSSLPENVRFELKVLLAAWAFNGVWDSELWLSFR